MKPVLLGDHPGHAQNLPVILGEAPSSPNRVGVYFPLSGAVGKRLCLFAGIEPDDDGSPYGRYYWPLRERFDCLNAIERHEDAYPWSVKRARERWTRWLLERPDKEQQSPLTVVCLGRKASDAVGHRADRPWGEWVEVGLLRVTAIPHPSGRNRLYNDETMRALAGRVLREAMV